jgi:hypothetical protein
MGHRERDVSGWRAERIHPAAGAEMERLIHSNDNAREAKVTSWIFEGSSLYVLIVSVALALAGFRYAYDRLGLGTWASAGVGAAPLVLASVYVLTLKLGKPKSYDVDVFRSLGMRLMRGVAIRCDISNCA